jgi:hypothetical protein
MKAIIQKIEKGNGDFQSPQINVEVIYQDERFPANHHFPEGGERKFIFTFPPEAYSGMTEEDLDRKIKAQGEAFIEILKKGEDMLKAETLLKVLEGNEIEI